jgi:hypothetical protein
MNGRQMDDVEREGDEGDLEMESEVKCKSR